MQGDKKGSPVKHRAGLTPHTFHSTLWSLRTLFSLCLRSWLCPKASASFPTLNYSLSKSPFFIMKIRRNRKRKRHDDMQLALGFLDWNQISCLWNWCQFAGCVTLGNYSTLLSCSFLMCKKKMILLGGWVANPNHFDSLAHAFNLDFSSSSGLVQSPGHLGHS